MIQGEIDFADSVRGAAFHTAEAYVLRPFFAAQARVGKSQLF